LKLYSALLALNVLPKEWLPAHHNHRGKSVHHQLSLKCLWVDGWKTARKGVQESGSEHRFYVVFFILNKERYFFNKNFSFSEIIVNFTWLCIKNVETSFNLASPVGIAENLVWLVQNLIKKEVVVTVWYSPVQADYNYLLNLIIILSYLIIILSNLIIVLSKLVIIFYQI
jgi:hypothetical protein